jgi:hypothetical protein
MPTHHRTEGVPSQRQHVSLAERHRRKREQLELLLDARNRLAIVATERRSHDLPGCWEDVRLLYLVEQIIERHWPDLFAERLEDWTAADDTLLHSPRRLHPECGICQAIAANRGGSPATPVVA